MATVEKISKSSLKYMRLSDKMKADWDRERWPYFNWWEEWIWITTPEASEPTKRLLWDPTMSDYATSIYEAVNELGADGWELISETVLGSVIVDSHGHARAGRQIDVRLWLKRPRSV